MLVFRMNKQFTNEMKKTRDAKKIYVSSKVKMTMIHEAFFTIFALLVAILDIAIHFLRMENTKSYRRFCSGTHYTDRKCLYANR